MIQLDFAASLLAQENDLVNAGEWTFASLIPVATAIVFVFGFLAFGCLLLSIILRHVRRVREFVHQERLKAIEVGSPWQDSDAETADAKFMHSAFWIAFWMVAIGSGASFGAVAALMEQPPRESVSVAIIAWVAAAAASISSLICATILMVKSRARGGTINDAMTPDRHPHRADD